MKTKCIFIVFLSFCFCSIELKAQQTAEIPTDLEKYMDTVLRTFEVPGISLAIVKDGKIVKTTGYGVKKLGEKTPVSDHTLFSIASNTKAFTAAAIEILVEENKLKWDDPVIQYLPWFKMSDPWVTAQFTIRDLLVHHSGIPGFAGDILIFPPSNYTRQEIVSKLKFIPLVNSFRTTYAYDNILYLAAGELIKTVSAMDWEEFIKSRILTKLEMKETISKFSDFKYQLDVSSGHSRVLGKIVIDQAFYEQAVGDAGNPAGGIASNAVDMSKWLIAQLDSGKGLNGQQIFHKKAINELWSIVTPTPITKPPVDILPAALNFSGYALGVKAYNYGQYKLVGHGGKLDGFVSQVVMVPELKLGIAVLTNQETTGAYWAIIYHLLDFYMHHPRFDWIKGYKTVLDSSLAKSKVERAMLKINPTENNFIPIADDKIIGKYRDVFYGDAVIAQVGSKLQLQFLQTPQFVADLIPFQFQTYLAKFHNTTLRADAYLSLSIGPDGNVDQFKLKMMDPDSDINFEELIFKTIK
jgi:CubicO group peptidase (beta-lactamase class C family)